MPTPPRHCAACGARLHGPFCSECGTAAGGRAPATRPSFPVHWLVLGVAAVMLVGVLVTLRPGAGTVPADGTPAASAPVPSVAPTGGSAPAGVASPVAGGAVDGTPPDIGSMTPRERFDRLFDRVMRASEGGDAATVTQFAPMAMAAFDLLDAPDADARFHAGLIRIASGDLAGARAMADAIAAQQPAHLFGILLRGRIAEVSGDAAGLQAAHRAFRDAYAAETAAQRPEYPGHQAIIDRFAKDSAQ